MAEGGAQAGQAATTGAGQSDRRAELFDYRRAALPPEGQYRYATKLYTDPFTGMTSPLPPPEPDPVQDLYDQVRHMHARTDAWTHACMWAPPRACACGALCLAVAPGTRCFVLMPFFPSLVLLGSTP